MVLDIPADLGGNVSRGHDRWAARPCSSRHRSYDLLRQQWESVMSIDFEHSSAAERREVETRFFQGTVIKRDTYFPPFWRMLSHLGVQLPSPLLAGFWPNVLTLAIPMFVFGLLLFTIVACIGLLPNTGQSTLFHSFVSSFLIASMVSFSAARRFNSLSRKHDISNKWRDFVGNYGAKN